MSFKYSLILPCYNESGALPYLFSEYGRLAVDRNLEVVFVNNGSADGTEAVYRDLLAAHPQFAPFFRYHHEPVNFGVGGGLKAGARVASGKWLIFCHADEQYDRRAVEGLIHLCETTPRDSDKVLFKGNRSARSVRDALFSRGFDAAAALTVGSLFFDINAQPKLFPAPPISFWRNAPDDYCIDVFLLASFKAAGYRIVSTTVRQRDRESGKSSWSRSWGGVYRLSRRYVQYLREMRPSELAKEL